MRKLTVLLIGLVWLSGLLPAQAAGAPWWVWLYGGNGSMVQVDSSGTTLQQWMLPGEAGATYSPHVAMSADGRYIGYGLTTSAGLASVNLYDVGSGTVFYSYSLPENSVTGLEFTASYQNFSPGNETFAFGYVVGYESYNVVVVDILAGVTATLTGADIQAGLGDGPMMTAAMIPVVQSNRPGVIQFTTVPYGIDGAAEYPCIEWQMETSYLGYCASYVYPWADTFANTGEVVLAMSDANFPGSAPVEGPGFVLNTVKAYTPDTGDLFTVTTLPNLTMARFIQDGERVVAVAYNGSGDNYTLNIMERSGAIAASVSVSYTSPITSLAGTLNGFVYTVGESGDAGGTTLSFVETRFNNPPLILSIWNSSLGADMRIAWTSDIRPEVIPTFAAWGRLNAPLSAPTLSAPSAPLAAGTLVIGGQATVYTTEGDVLNLRSGPGRSFQRVGTLGNGSIVTLLEGPFAADGFNWWRVRLANGQEGWVVDFADGVPTLIAS